MIVRCYTGNSIECIHKRINDELGPAAVLVATREIPAAGILKLGRGKKFEVTAVLEDAQSGTQQTAPAGAGAESPATAETQQAQYRGLRQAIRLLDEKVASLDSWMSWMAEQSDCDKLAPLQRRIHPEWREQVQARALGMAADSVLTAEHWIRALAEQIRVAPGLPVPRYGAKRPAVCVIAGATGVGKTTTVAKLAANALLNKKQKVALITMDTFRVAGIEQLRMYAGLLGVELEVAFSANEFERHVQRFSDRDLILVDSPGRSPFDNDGIMDIRERLGVVLDLSVLLLVPAAIRRHDVEHALNAYAPLSPAGLIITKTDEASSADGITKLLELAGVPVYFLTNGQNVPEDLVVPTAWDVAALCCQPRNSRAAAGAETEPENCPQPAGGAR